MALVRCKGCGRPTRNVRVPYVSHHQPVGYPNTAAICGADGCRNPGLVWLTQSEENDYQGGERIFAFRSATSKVRVA